MPTLPRTILALCAVAPGCADDAPAAPAPPSWPCPPQWVAHAQGGCGPAVVLCAPEGGAALGACDGLDLSRPRPLADTDGGVSFSLLPDGGVGGAWPESLPELSVEAGIPACPARWERLGDGTCEPVFEDNCAAAQEYPELGALPPGARVVHVRAGAAGAPPDGTQDAPFPTLSGALAGATGETWLRIAPGTYRENLTLRGRVHLAGCRHRVIVEGADAARATILATQTPSRVELLGLTVRGEGYGVLATVGAGVTLRSVDVVSAHGAGVVALGQDLFRSPSRIALTDCAIRDTLPSQGAQPLGIGLRADMGGVVTAERTVLQGNRAAGVFSVGTSAGGEPSRVELTGCVVRDTLPTPTGNAGYGLNALGGASVIAVRTLLQGNHSVGALAARTASRIELTECVVRDTLPRAQDLSKGEGVSAEDGGTVHARRTRISRNHTVGAVALGADARVELTDCVVEDTLPTRRDRVGGGGLSAQLGGLLLASRTLVQRNQEAGVTSSAAGPEGRRSRVELTECVVRDTLPRASDQDLGHGLGAQQGGVLLAARTLVQGNHTIGVVSSGADPEPSLVELTECVVRDTLPRQADQTGGFAVSAQRGGVLRVLRSRLRGSTLTAAFSVGASGELASRVSLSDTSVQETRATRVFGVSLVALAGGRLEASRVVVTQSQMGGAMASGEGSVLRAEDLLLFDVAPVDTRGGFGLTASSGAQVEARRVSIVRSHGAAIASLPSTALLGAPRGSRLVMTDGYVLGVGAGVLDFDPCRPSRSVGLPRAYGVYVGGSSAAELRRVVLRGAGTALAFFGGSISWTEGAVSGSGRFALRGTSVVTPRAALLDVVWTGVGDPTVQDDPSLTDERLPEPMLDPGRGPSGCRGGS